MHVYDLQEDNGLPGVPVFARQLPERILPLPQQEEDEADSSEQASQAEHEYDSSGSDASSSAEEPAGNADRILEQSTPVNAQEPSKVLESENAEEAVAEPKNDTAQGDRSLERKFPVSAAVGAESNDGGSAEVSDGAETSPECNGGGSADVPDEADNPPEITSEDLWGSESGSEGDVGDNATEHAPNSAATGKPQATSERSFLNTYLIVAFVCTIAVDDQTWIGQG